MATRAGIAQVMFLLLAFCWMVLIFTLSHQPSLPAPSLFPHQDKLFHAVTYGILGFLLLGGLPDGPRRLLLAWLLASLYGCSDEIHQMFVPGRSAELLDLAADSGGALLGAWVGRFILPVMRLAPGRVANPLSE